MRWRSWPPKVTRSDALAPTEIFAGIEVGITIDWEIGKLSRCGEPNYRCD